MIQPGKWTCKWEDRQALEQHGASEEGFQAIRRRPPQWQPSGNPCRIQQAMGGRGGCCERWTTCSGEDFDLARVQVCRWWPRLAIHSLPLTTNPQPTPLCCSGLPFAHMDTPSLDLNRRRARWTLQRGQLHIRRLATRPRPRRNDQRPDASMPFPGANQTSGVALQRSSPPVRWPGTAR